jgi:hypothetical protein
MKYLKLVLVLSSVILSVMSRRSHRRRRNHWGDGATGADLTCSDFRVEGNRLYANCEDNSKKKIATGIDMSRCLQNKNGVLTEGGAYQNSCSNMSVDASTKTIIGTCQNESQQPLLASLPIGGAFGNQNGVLVC